MDGLDHKIIDKNIGDVVRNIPKEHYTNIIKGAYERNTED